MIGRLLCKLGPHKWRAIPGTAYFIDKYTEGALMRCDRNCGTESRTGERMV